MFSFVQYVSLGAPVAVVEVAVGGAGSVLVVSLTHIWLMLPAVSTVQVLMVGGWWGCDKKSGKRFS
jgi:hypothetical protein